MIIFERTIEKSILELLFRKKAILIFGPRQAGKTTLAKKIVTNYGDNGAYFNCESMEVRKNFVLGDAKPLKEMFGNKKIVVLDEAQTIQNIGAILKLYIDTYNEVQIIATGSSSFDLANKINEPLTGRSFEFTLYPLSLEEIRKTKKIDKEEILELMRTGLYPEIVGQDSKKIKSDLLKNIATNYLYKDIYIFESIRNPQIFEDIIKMLAFQIGQLVSINEISKATGASRGTVEKYLKLLEQAYIIKKVRPFSKNSRNELKKSFKVYFLDLGVRNTIVGNLNELETRKDKGFVFENFVFLELLKNYNKETFSPQIYFWRTDTKLEIDFIVYKNDTVEALECKWSSEEVSFKKFLKLYPEATTRVLTPESFLIGPDTV